MSAGQNVGPLDREARRLFQPPLPPDEATWALAAAAGISTVGLRPSFVIPAAAHSHPDCRAVLILIVAPQSGEVDYVGSISKCGDRRVRTLLYEAANVMLTRYKGQLKLKDWAFAIAKRSTMRKARVVLARRLGIIMHAMLRDKTEFILA